MKVFFSCLQRIEVIKVQKVVKRTKELMLSLTTKRNKAAKMNRLQVGNKGFLLSHYIYRLEDCYDD